MDVPDQPDLPENSINLDFVGKDDAEMALKRIYAWYEGQIIDRPPIRFAAHNAQYNQAEGPRITAEQWKARWFDAEQVIENFVKSLEGRRFLAETFPIYWPNLGPDVYAAYHGCELLYSDVTSWSEPCIRDPEDIKSIQFDRNGTYFKKTEELMALALAQCPGKFMVGYTDLHPGIDCVAAWRGLQSLCFDLIDNPEMVKTLIQSASQEFHGIYRHFDAMLKQHNQMSVTWMEIPSLGTMYIPSCDFATMMSPRHFQELALPVLEQEVESMTHNIFHLDGKGVARHLDTILAVPGITAIQWVQGVGDDEPILQWLPLIKRIQAAGKSVVVDLKVEELDAFMEQMKPEGLFLCIAEGDEQQQRAIMKRTKQWT